MEGFARAFVGPVSLFSAMSTGNSKIVREKLKGVHMPLKSTPDEIIEEVAKQKVLDPNTRLYYLWSFVISLAFLYNFWFIVYRIAFEEITINTIVNWFILDYTADLIYLFDIIIQFRTGYLDEGVLITDLQKIKKRYLNNKKFYIDLLAIMPFDLFYLLFGFYSGFRVLRIIKAYWYLRFIDHCERHTNHPNLVRSIKLLHYLLAIIHWNSCLFHFIYYGGSRSIYIHTGYLSISNDFGILI